MKTKLLIMLVFLLVFVDTAYAYADDFYSEFIIDGYTVTTYGAPIIELSLNWGSQDLDFGSFTLSEPINGTVKLVIPKSIPRMTNLDFGISLYAIQTDESWGLIKERESNCFYHLEIPVNNADYVEIIGATVATGRWVSVSIMDQSCGDFTLKQQLQNNVKSSEIICKNESHILAKRDNGELACVYPYSMVKLNWEPTRYTYYIESIMKEDKQYNIFAYFSQTKNIDGLRYDEDGNSLTVFVYSDIPEKLSLKFKRGLFHFDNENCVRTSQNFNDLFVLINGEEVIFNERPLGEKYRYLEIQVDLASTDVDAKRVAEQIHLSIGGRQYQIDSKIVEIIGICLI